MQPVENTTHLSFAAATPMRAKKSAKKRKKTSTRVQTLIFDRKLFTLTEARNWARTHDFKSSGVDETEDSYRIRQRDPSRFKSGSFKTVELTKGVKAVVGRLR